MKIIFFIILPKFSAFFKSLSLIISPQPAYFTSLVPFEATADKNKGRKDGGAVSDGQETGEMEKSEAGRTNGEENDGATVRTDASPQLQFGTYKEAVKKYYLHYKDFDMVGLWSLNTKVMFMFCY